MRQLLRLSCKPTLDLSAEAGVYMVFNTRNLYPKNPRGLFIHNLFAIFFLQIVIASHLNIYYILACFV